MAITKQKIRSSAYTDGIADALRFNPEIYEPKRQSMINFSATNYNFINFSKLKQPDQLIKVCNTIDSGTSRQTQLRQYKTIADPGINIGRQAAGIRMTKPCYLEYGICGYL